MLLQRTDGFHKATLKAVTDTHDLSGRFHLCGQCSFCADEFIKWQTRHLNDTIVQHRLKACHSLSGNCIFDLIQCISDGNLCSHLCNRITSCLRSQCRRTAYTRVYLDHTVLKALRMKSKLYVTSSGDLQLTDDIQCRSTEHLIFFIPQSLGRCYNDTVTGMHADRVDIFHVADGDHISCSVTHYLVLDLFPACDTTLNQNLTYTGQTKSICKDLFQFFLIVCDSTAASTKRIRRTKHYRITDLIGKCDTILQILNNQRRSYRLADLLHGCLEFQTVLCFFDGLGSRTDQFYTSLLEESSLIQLHCQIQSCLSSKSRQHAVRLFFQDQLFNHIYCQWFNINTVCNVFIRHDRSRVRVEKNNLKSLFLQRTAGLCTCIVKLGSLSDDDRARTDHQYFFNIRILRHSSFPPSFSKICQTGNWNPAVQGMPPDGTEL